MALGGENELSAAPRLNAGQPAACLCHTALLSALCVQARPRPRAFRSGHAEFLSLR